MVRLLTPEDVCEQLQVPISTLYKWRERNYGPPALKVGKFLRYQPADVEAFIASLAPESNVTPIRRSA